jgi:hypothetical protein
MPNIEIPLGLSLEATPCVDALRKRARLRVELAAANRPELAFLNKSDFAEKSPLVDVDCWRRLNIDHLCRLNFDQGLLLAA